MNDVNKNSQSDVVDQAVEALKGLPVPDGPRAAAIEKLQAALANEPSPQRTKIMKIAKLFTPARLTAAAAVILVVVGAYVFSTRGIEASIAFADVRQKIEQAQTMVCRIVMTLAQNADGRPIEMKMMFKDPGMMRQEMSVTQPGGEPVEMVQIIRMAGDGGGRVLSLLPGQKKAFVVELGELPKEATQRNWLAEIKKLVQKSESPLGEQVFDGTTTQGWAVTHGGVELSIWVDVETHLPFRMEMQLPESMGQITFADFDWDVELDDALFAMEVPEGYSTQSVDMDLSNPTEDDLVAGLGSLADLNDGVFPKTLMVTPELQKKLADRFGNDDQAAMTWAKPFARMMMFVQLQSKHGKFEYFGGGVEHGDAETPIAYYSTAEGGYRVVYGDLHVEDADAPPAAPAVQDEAAADVEEPAGQAE